MLCTGSRVPRDLPVTGASCTACTSRWSTCTSAIAISPAPLRRELTAAGKHVIVIGGGDTGADCVASAHREGAASVTQIELLGEPPAKSPGRADAVAALAAKLRTSYALKEGGERQFSISTSQLSGNGRVEQIHWLRNSGAPPFEPVGGTEESHPAELVLLAMGFVGPEPALLDAARRRDATRVATSRRPNTRRACAACSPPVTHAAASR